MLRGQEIIMAKLCDICGIRPATVRVRVTQNGESELLELCDVDYERLAAQQRPSSPMESLFGRRGGLLEDFFGDDFFGRSALGGTDGGGSPGRSLPSGRSRGARGGGGPVESGEPARRSAASDVEDRISEHAKELLQTAARHAVERGRREVDTEHLLLALLDSDVVQTVLGEFKVKVDDLRRQIESEAPRSEASDEDTGEIGVTPRVKNALGHAFGAARELGHSYVGPEHFLIGLAEEGEGIASDILRRYGLTSQSLRQQVVKVVGRGAEEGQVGKPSNTPNLDKYSRDLTQMAREGKLDPVIGRAREIETTIEILARRKKNNPVLIGEPGVGKTAIVEGLAQRILAGEVPDALRDKRLVELSVNSMIAGSKYRGEFEERAQQILTEVKEQEKELILFIDEVHMIVGAGAAEGGADIANVFKPAMARGELNLIGATTLNEYQKHIEKDAALERRFQPVVVAEPTLAQTIMILRGLRDTLEAHHKVAITEEAIVAAAELSDRYVTGRFLPDKAIDLIDQAAARVKISATARPPELQELESEVRQLKREIDYATSRKQTDRAKDLQRQYDEKCEQQKQATEQWRRSVGSGSAEVTAEHVAQVVSKLTGIPVSELTSEERQKLLELEQRLHQRVIGQDQAIKAVSDAVRIARSGLREGGRTVANFLFLGPTGVGKTELAKALAETVYGDEDALIRVDMSEYMERHTVARLIGAPPGYVGYDEGGQLTERVRRKPFSVVLLDEIEKAHADVYNVLLQVFDDGRLTDGKGRVVDFSNTMIIATSNLGADIIERRLRQQGEADVTGMRQELMVVLRDHFRPEFINRIDEIIVFHSLDREQIRAIVELQLERVRRMARGEGIELEVDESHVSHLAEEGYRPEFGARELRRLIRQELETALSRAMLSDELTEGQRAVARWDPAEGKVSLEVKAQSDAERRGAASPPKSRGRKAETAPAQEPRSLSDAADAGEGEGGEPAPPAAAPSQADGAGAVEART
jgi:ATP-dependent Clp protease ATP-binding subunit ClpC